MATPPAMAMALAVAMAIPIFFIPAFAQVYLWPQPRSIQWETGEPSFVLNTTFFIDSPFHPELRQAAKRCRDLIFKENWLPLQVSSFWTPNSGSLQYLSNLSIRVEDLLADLQHGVDESYSLSVDSLNGAVLAAATPWGAIHGLETFSQLIRRKNASSDVLLIQNGVTIWDAPLFPHRGVLLDTSRNFYPVADILRTIKAMGHNKLNVFHWHITDSQSFPIHISSEPDLSAKGSYGSRFTYYPADVKKIISYARSVGVRVMPEIDAPAHSASWGSAYPEIVTCQNEFWYDSSKPWSERMASEPGPGQLNPLNPKTYTVVKNVIDAIADLFPESFFHAGGDEVAPACWETDQAIAELVTRLGRAPAMRYLLDTFIKNTYPKITSHSKMVVYWEDILLGAEVNASSSLLPKSSTIIQTWSAGLNSTKTITEAGYRAIVSSYDFYYLDCGHGGFLGNDSQYDTMENGGDGGSWCNPFKTWQKIYDFDITAGLSKKEKELVLGGEVALWSEQSDGTVVDSRIWPRAAAIAESLWSGNRGFDGKKRYGEALSRLNDWRYRLVARGIFAEPLQPFWCLKHPGQCDA